MTRLLGFALAVSVAGQPVTLRLSAEKPKYVAGEGVRLKLHVRAEAAGELESVELNRAATRIHLRRAGAPATVLTGADHIRLFPDKALAGVGSTFSVRAKQEWDAELDLLQYARPLTAGRYTVEVEYRGARSGPATFEIVPAQLGHSRWRWFGGTELAGVYAANGKWFHTARPKRDLSVVLFATEIGSARPDVSEVPRSAYFPGIAGTRVERIVVWAEQAKLCWLPVTGSGPAGSARCESSGLQAPIRIAEPALQTADGELRAVVFANGRLVEMRAGSSFGKRTIAERKGLRDVAVSWEPEPRLLLAEDASISEMNWSGEAKRLGAFTGAWTGFETEEWNGASTIVAATKTQKWRWRSDRPGLERTPAGFQLRQWRIEPSTSTGFTAR